MNGFGWTPLLGAAKYGHDAVVKLLLDTGRVDHQCNEALAGHPLLGAAENGHDAVVKLLLDTGQVNIGTTNSSGQTPLSRAAENGHDATVKLPARYRPGRSQCKGNL